MNGDWVAELIHAWQKSICIAGVPFAKAVASGHECVVTGGPGAIEVDYMRNMYYVCCSGCRDYFRENAEPVLAEFRKRKTDDKLNRNK